MKKNLRSVPKTFKLKLQKNQTKQTQTKQKKGRMKINGKRKSIKPKIGSLKRPAESINLYLQSNDF